MFKLPVAKNCYGDVVVKNGTKVNDGMVHKYLASIDELCENSLKENVPFVIVHVREDNPDVVTPLLKRGFKMLTVIDEGKYTVLRMYLPLRPSVHDKMPRRSNHFATVEIVCLHYCDEWDEPHVLCVEERVRSMHRKYKTDANHHLKLVTGKVEKHELVCSAAYREMLEELYMVTVVVGVLGVWEDRFSRDQLVGLTFGILVVLGDMQSHEPLKVNPTELASARWVPLSDAKKMFENRREGSWLLCDSVMCDVNTNRTKNWRGHISSSFTDDTAISSLVLKTPRLNTPESFTLKEEDLRGKTREMKKILKEKEKE